MIISPEELKENTFYQICSKLDEIYYTKFSPQENQGRGRPKKYSDLQMIKCLLYKVKNKIYCLRELESKLKEDLLALGIIKLNDVPDHSTFALRFNQLEKMKFNILFQSVIKELNPDTRITSIDATALRSSKNDSDAKLGVSTNLGRYKGYKLHLIASNDSIPLSFKFTTGNVYDNTFDYCKEIMEPLGEHDIFILLGDAAYDSTKLFKLADDLGFKLLTDINYRNADSIDDFTDKCRIENGIYFNSPMGEKMYKNRLTIERSFSILKERYNLEAPRLYGFKRYRSHVMWTLLLYLIEKLIDKENGITDNKFSWNR
ncbi:ISNCY-like element ISAcar1 family transposase [Acetohalobium arabaticum]|uniref:Transposase IS4 family protein n=1 Tax=Acetohalobium arabaticum (strain ATCC 49924 / DSM 5501 / Z-7288) TaxID=574087 RepID=D9QPR2_ACEAZ|nr:ISNCY-like element ISAcar1 family transposase [Acetohalobium arabaticum]ADL12503.1 transposase IS4 family protein [Acetohalobium arabaticum DSM 5501]